GRSRRPRSAGRAACGGMLIGAHGQQVGRSLRLSFERKVDLGQRKVSRLIVAGCLPRLMANDAARRELFAGAKSLARDFADAYAAMAVHLKADSTISLP